MGDPSPSASALRPEGISALERLPDELLLHILSFIQNQQDYLHLASTNKRLCHLSREFIYATSHIGSRPRADLFLRTLTTCPEVGPRVTNIALILESNNERSPVIDISTLADSLERLEVPDASESLQGYHEGSTEYLFFFILSQTPNVRILQVNFNEVYYGLLASSSPWIRLLASAAISTPIGSVHCFEHLHTLEFQQHADEIVSLSPILALPSLRKVSFRYMDQEKLGTWGCLEGTSAVTHLFVDRCFIRWEVALDLLKSFKRLERLRYRQTNAADFADIPKVRGIHFPTIGDLLRGQSDSLRSATVIDQPRRIGDYLPREGCLGDLRGLSLISHFTVSYEAIAGVGQIDCGCLSEWLPSSVRSLRIPINHRQEGIVIRAALKALVLAPDERFPNLKEVELVFQFRTSVYERDTAQFEMLRTLFQERKRVKMWENFEGFGVFEYDDSVWNDWM